MDTDGEPRKGGREESKEHYTERSVSGGSNPLPLRQSEALVLCQCDGGGDNTGGEGEDSCENEGDSKCGVVRTGAAEKQSG